MKALNFMTLKLPNISSTRQVKDSKRLYLRGKVLKYSDIELNLIKYILIKQLTYGKLVISQSKIAEAIGSDRSYVCVLLGQTKVIKKIFRGYTYNKKGEKIDRPLGYEIDQDFINDLSSLAITDNRFVGLLNVRNNTDSVNDNVRIQMFEALNVKNRHHFNRFSTNAIAHAYKYVKYNIKMYRDIYLAVGGKVFNDINAYVYFVARDYHRKFSVPFM